MNHLGRLLPSEVAKIFQKQSRVYACNKHIGLRGLHILSTVKQFLSLNSLSLCGVQPGKDAADDCKVFQVFHDMTCGPT